VLSTIASCQKLAVCDLIVARIAPPGRDTFLREYYAPGRPVIIEGALDHWPAIQNWSFKELKADFAGRIVEVQAARDGCADYEASSDVLKSRMLFGDLIDHVVSGSGNDVYMTANNSGANREALHELWADFGRLPQYLQAHAGVDEGFLWIGPAGTVTPLHHDLTNNFMAQVKGRKRVLLVPLVQTPYVYNHLHCYSRVDPENPDCDRFPLFRNCSIFQAEIGPGDLLFLPVGWWRHVRALEASITLSFTNFVFRNDFAESYNSYGKLLGAD